MPWWERRMFIEILNEEFAEPESEQNVHDDISAFGITPHEIA